MKKFIFTIIILLCFSSIIFAQQPNQFLSWKNIGNQNSRATAVETFVFPQKTANVMWLRHETFTNTVGKYPNSGYGVTNGWDFAPVVAKVTYVNASTGIYYKGNYYAQPGSYAVGAYMGAYQAFRITISVWCRITTAVAASSLLSNRFTSPSLLGFDDDGRTLSFRIGTWIQQLGPIKSDSQLPLNTWVHVVATFNQSAGSTSGMRLYTNGILAKSGANNTNASALSPYQRNWYIGNDEYDLQLRAFNGYIDDEAVWVNVALTSNEVYNLYRLGH